MLSCCGKHFYAAEKIMLPLKNGMIYRCLEYGHCPNCYSPVSRLIEQNKKYDVFVKDRRGQKADSAYDKAIKQRKKFLEQVNFGSKSNQNFSYGDFKKTKRFDENNQPIYLQLRKNFNNHSEILGEVITHYSKI
jgi:prolyl oligopeptidase PreP (S9A serine peptidase family)